MDPFSSYNIQRSEHISSEISPTPNSILRPIRNLIPGHDRLIANFHSRFTGTEIPGSKNRMTPDHRFHRVPMIQLFHFGILGSQKSSNRGLMFPGRVIP